MYYCMYQIFPLCFLNIFNIFMKKVRWDSWNWVFGWKAMELGSQLSTHGRDHESYEKLGFFFVSVYFLGKNNIK